MLICYNYIVLKFPTKSLQNSSALYYAVLGTDFSSAPNHMSPVWNKKDPEWPKIRVFKSI